MFRVKTCARAKLNVARDLLKLTTCSETHPFTTQDDYLQNIPNKFLLDYLKWGRRIARAKFGTYGWKTNLHMYALAKRSFWSSLLDGIHARKRVS